MSYRLITVMTFCLVFSVPGLQAGEKMVRHRPELTKAVDNLVQQELASLLAFYKDLHAHPELSGQERESSRKIAERLEQLGYSVTSNVGGYGVVGVLSNGAGPTVLIRGDMDALPIVEETGVPYASKVEVRGASGSPVGVMHACGHDVHQTCLVGAAHVLANTKEHWRGTVVMIAQPAEEIGTGAKLMIEDGLFKRFPKPDFCLGLHVSGDLPAGEIGFTPGWAMANVDSVDISIFGQGGHGSRPNQAIDPVVAAAHVIVALQTVVSRRVDPIEPGVITVGSVHGGSKHNIIPDDARLQITVRSYTDETRRILLDGIRDVTVNTCRAMGCKRDPEIVVRDDEFTPAGYNHPALAVESAGLFRVLLGDKRVQELPARMGGEDFGRYAKELDVPGFMYWLGSIEENTYQASIKPNGPALPPLHSSKYAPDPEPTLYTGVKSMASLALSLLEKK